MGGSMKVHHQFARVLWEHEPSLTLAGGCNKRLRPLAPKLPTASFDLKSFIRPESGPRKLASSDDTTKKDPPSPQPPQVETQIPGGTRWNPTQEQIGILEMLYRSGMRTPNAQQIEQITGQLSKYGKIEGKNVFYWFQNHKARERQKQKRSSLGLLHTPRTPLLTTTTHTMPLERRDHQDQLLPEDSPYKKKCRRWVFETLLMERDQCKDQDHDQDDEDEHRTLELFPLHPEGMMR